MNIGKMIITIGVVLIGIGILYAFTPFGKLPGDINHTGKNIRFHIPLVSSLILSIVLTIIFNLLQRR
jgi:hypothetical protein